jgi:hypothetical protein
MTDISDKAVQDALRAAEGGLLLTKGQVATLRARFEADARAIRAASVIAHKRRPHWKDWDDLDAALAAREQVK